MLSVCTCYCNHFTVQSTLLIQRFSDLRSLVIQIPLHLSPHRYVFLVRILRFELCCVVSSPNLLNLMSCTILSLYVQGTKGDIGPAGSVVRTYMYGDNIIAVHIISHGCVALCYHVLREMQALRDQLGRMVNLGRVVFLDLVYV